MATIRNPAALVRLRPGRADDLDDVMWIMSAAFEPCFGEGWTRSQCAGILPMSGVRLTVAEGPHSAAGFSLARCVADEAELLLIAVDPANQRSGVGQFLLDDFIETARNAGATKLHLEVRDGNPAIAMYRTAGFEIAGRRRNYYRGPDGQTYDAVTLMMAD
jgi:ribosomal-protein-alanine N-acetyltransferase